MSVKVLDGESLRETMDSRAHHYSSIREQFVQLRKAFQDIVDLDEFEGQGAEAIKGFYRGQIEVTEAWQRLIDRQIAFFEGVQGKLEDKSLGGNTRVETGFLKEELAHKERQADEMVSEQRKALHNIFAEIEDLVSLDPFSRDRFDSEMVEARKKRTDTLDAVEQTDQELLEEYLSSEGEEFYAAALFRALLDATKQGSNVSPIHFNATAYHTSDAYQRKVDAEAQTDAYLSFKKEEKEAREIANRPWYEDLWEGTKTFAGEFSGYYDYLRAKDGVDPVTGEELSAGQRVAAGAMAAAGFIPIVGWAGRAIKGGKGIYSATKAISAADHALDAYKSANAFSALEKTEMGLYGLIAANGLSEYMTGKDMFGNELTDEQRHASLAQGVFAGLPFVPSMAREAASMGKGWIGNVKQHLSVSPKLVTENGIVHVDDAVKADSKVVEPVSREKDESLSLLSGRSDEAKETLEVVEDINARVISDADRTKLDGWAYPPSEEKYLKYKEVYDNPRYYDQESGNINWPANNGFEGEPVSMKLDHGILIDRYGSPAGTFVSPAGIPYEQRALALHSDEAPYHKYEILIPFDVEAGKIAPWFDRIGGGTQYYTGNTQILDFESGEMIDATVENLEKLGYIREIK